jgi:hypothetical protein
VLCGPRAVVTETAAAALPQVAARLADAIRSLRPAEPPAALPATLV